MGEILSFLKDLAVSFDFDTELNTKKTIEIKGTNLYVNGKLVEVITTDTLNIHEAAKITNAIYEKLNKKEAKHFASIATYSIIQEIKYLQDLCELLRSIKKLHCSPYNSAYERFSWNLDYIIRRADIEAYAATKERPYPERLALSAIDTSFLDDIAAEEMCDKDVDTVLSIVAATKKSINEFDYKDYPVNMVNIVNEFSKQCDKLTKECTLLKKFIEVSGGKLVDWGTIKIRNEMRKAGLPIHHTSISIVLANKEILLKSGATPKANTSALGQSKLALVSGTATQEQLLRLFKQGTAGEAEKAVSFMSLVTLKEIITSDLTIITNQLKMSYGCYGIAVIILNALYKIAPTDTLLIAEYMTKYNLWSHLPDNFIAKGIDIMTPEMLKSYAKSCPPDTQRLNKAQFKKALALLKPEEYYSISEHFTRYFFLYGTTEQKIHILNNYTNLTFKVNGGIIENCSDIPTKTLREILVKNSGLLGWFKDFIIAQKYHDLIKIALEQHHDSDFLAALPVTERIPYIIKHSYWTDLKINNVTEAEILLEGLCKHNESDESTDSYDSYGSYGTVTRHISIILQYIFENDVVTKKIVKVLNNYHGKIDLAHVASDKIPDHWKMVFLRNDCLRDYKQPSYNSRYAMGYTESNNLLRFFNTLPRDALIALFGSSFDTPFVSFLGHCMTQEELESFAEKEKSFLYLNMQYLTYEYLKKYKDKEELRKRLGDLRDSFSATIRYKIEERIKTLENGGAK